MVRAAHDGEKLVTLDGQERELTHDMCLITDDGHTPIALAGVMGGLDSEITEETVDVLLESANFSSGHTSRTSRNLDLMSEASIRYERKVDGSNCANVAEIAAALFEECCGAEVCPGIVDVYSLNNSGHLTLTGMDDSGRAAHVGTNFVNNAGATLETGFTADGQVAGIEADSARLDGTWLLRPLRDFYANQAVITPESPVSVSGGTLSGSFSDVALVADLSPTLDFDLNTSAADQPQINVSRAADAYKMAWIIPILALPVLGL